MIRHHQNNNLKIFNEPLYRGLPVQLQRGPLIENYLEQTYKVILSAISQHPRTFAFRVDLHFPDDNNIYAPSSNKLLERFIASFKAKIKHNRSVSKPNNGHIHETAVRYIWCREIKDQASPHYHLAFLLNKDAFFVLGQYKIGRQNIFNRLIESWSSALGLPVESTKGLVHIPDNATYLLTRNDPFSIADLFFRLSYLSKVESKQYGDRLHCFGSSRV
jgi:hypothetical protein